MITLTTIGISMIALINNVLVPIVFAISFIVFLYGVATKYILSNGDEGKVKEGHKLILWGIIGFVVMVSLWGIVNVVANAFSLNSFWVSYPPSPPQSQ